MDSNNNQNLVEYQPATDVPAITDDSLIAIAESAERRVEAMNRIKRAALAVTNANDWVNQGGKPYLAVSGGEKIGRLFGVSWRIDPPELTEEEGGHYSYTYKGYFRLGSAEIEAIGSRSSKDPFFSRAHGNDVPPSEIDRNNVKKAAYTNLLGNGITRLLGIRNMTWEDINSAGIKTEGVGTVEYGKAEMSKEAKDQKAEIRKMVLEMSGGNNSKAQSLLETLTSFEGRDGQTVKGKRTVDKLSEKAVPVTYGKVKEAYENWKKLNAEHGDVASEISEEDVPFNDEQGGSYDGADADSGQQSIG